jgi:cyclophilin family peptidyl-prolyl cis-trans isomerase
LLGDIVFALYSTAAPLTCKTFLKRVESNYYDGCSFYRVSGGKLYGGCAHDKEAESPVELGTLEYKYVFIPEMHLFSCILPSL